MALKPGLQSLVLRAPFELEDGTDEARSAAEAFFDLTQDGVKTHEFGVGDPGQALVLVNAIDPELLRLQLLDGFDQLFLAAETLVDESEGRLDHGSTPAPE